MASTTPNDTLINTNISSPLLQCPPEILSMIFSPVNVGKKALVARGPLCSTILPFYQMQIYRFIVLQKSTQWPLLYSALSKNQDLAKLIKSFTFTETALYGVNKNHPLSLLGLMTEMVELNLISGHSAEHSFCSFADGSWLETVGTKCRSLQHLSVSIFATSNGESTALQLKPLNSLPNLQSIHLSLHLAKPRYQYNPLPTVAPPAIEIKLPATFWNKIRHLKIITETFSNQQLLSVGPNLSGLTNLEFYFNPHSSHEGPIDLNLFHTFLWTIPPAQLESLTMKQDTPRDLVYPAPYPLIDEFLSKCTKLKKLDVGFPILGPDLTLTSLFRLESLELSRGVGIPAASIESFIQAYDASSRKSKKPLKLLLSDVEVGEMGKELGDMLCEHGEGELDYGSIVEMMERFEWCSSDWNAAVYGRAAAARLIRLGKGKGIVMGGDIVRAIAVDKEYEEELSGNLRMFSHRERRDSDYY